MAKLLKWNDGDRNGTSLLAILDAEFPDANAAIAKFEAAADTKGDWDYDEDTGYNWWGLHGTYDGIVFTVYTHKSGTIKIGAHRTMGTYLHSFAALDLDGLKAALLDIAYGKVLA